MVLIILARITLRPTLPQGLASVSSRPPLEVSSGVSLEATVRIAGVGVSVIDASPRELLYLTVGGISLDYLREEQVVTIFRDDEIIHTAYIAKVFPCS